jgi:hypothetical protein
MDAIKYFTQRKLCYNWRLYECGSDIRAGLLEGVYEEALEKELCVQKISIEMKQ